MNNAIKQAGGIVISARKALFEHKKIDFALSGEKTLVWFSFAPKFLCRQSVVANSVCEWFDGCLQRGLQDIKFVIPANGENRHLLGFANTSQCAIICFWKNGRMASFCPTWEYDQEKEVWNVHYNEKRMKKNALAQKLCFGERTDEFKKILLDIKELAVKLEQPFFADIFCDAYAVLDKTAAVTDDCVTIQLPDELKAIYYAVDRADMFGAMGSWNDSPWWFAQDKGLEKEYDELSNELLVQVRYHLMYVVNTCWQRTISRGERK